MSKKTKGPAIAPADARWDRLIVYCGKCAGKLDQGKALRHDLKKALKDRGLGKRVRVIETGCLDVCPKDGITACATGSAEAAQPIVLRAGISAEEVLDRLLPDSSRA